MTIQPLSPRPREISVTEAVDPAYERVKVMLFRPFNFSKWIIMGFCAWLAGLGERGGFAGAFNGFNNREGGGQATPERFRLWYGRAHDYVLANLFWLVPLGICLAIVAVGIWLAVLWLNSRGKFMFLHCVALDQADVETPWHQYAAPGNRLFWFRLAVGLVGTVLCLPLLFFLAAAVFQMLTQGEPEFAAAVTALGAVLGLLLVGILLALVRKFTTDFVVPVMYLRGGTCLGAWGEVWRLMSTWPAQFAVYILFQIVLKIAISALVLAIVLITCCVAGCFLALPFIGTVLLLPILIFQRAYSLYYLAQYGAEFDVFPKPLAAPLAPGAPLPPLGAVGA